MRVPLAPQAQEILGTHDVVRRTERVAEVARRIGPRVTRGGGEVWDRPLPRPGTHRRRRGGGTAVLGLASLVPAGAHRTVAGAPSRTGLHDPVSRLTAPVSAPRDVRDDRGRPRRTHVRKPASGHQMPQTARPVAWRSRPGRRTCAAVRPPRSRGPPRSPPGDGARVARVTRRRHGPSAPSGGGRGPPGGCRGRRRGGRGHAPLRAAPSHCASVSGSDGRPPGGGVAALGRGGRGPPARRWRRPRTGTGRRGRGLGRRRRPWTPGAPWGGGQARPTRARGAGPPRTAGPRGVRPRARRGSGPAVRRTAAGQGAPGGGAGAPPGRPPPGRGGGNTSPPCGAPPDGPPAPQRAGATSPPRRRAPRGGDGPRAPRAAGGRVAPRPLGHAGQAAPPSRGARARRGAPRAARHPAHPCPPHAARAAARPPGGTPPRRGVARLGHPGGAPAAVGAGGGVGLSSRRARGTPRHAPHEPRPSRPAVGHTPRAHGGPHVPGAPRGPGVKGPGGCPATVSGDSAGQTPRCASRAQAQADRHAHG